MMTDSNICSWHHMLLYAGKLIAIYYCGGLLQKNGFRVQMSPKIGQLVERFSPEFVPPRVLPSSSFTIVPVTTHQRFQLARFLAWHRHQHRKKNWKSGHVVPRSPASSSKGAAEAPRTNTLCCLLRRAVLGFTHSSSVPSDTHRCSSSLHLPC